MESHLLARTMLMTAYRDAPDAIKLDAHEAPTSPYPEHPRLIELQVELPDRGR